jgi:hypothetical protein
MFLSCGDGFLSYRRNGRLWRREHDEYRKNEKILEIAHNMGYGEKNLKEFKRLKAKIFKMDIWDISKILFFGRTWEQY